MGELRKVLARRREPYRTAKRMLGGRFGFIMSTSHQQGAKKMILEARKLYNKYLAVPILKALEVRKPPHRLQFHYFIKLQKAENPTGWGWDKR